MSFEYVDLAFLMASKLMKTIPQVIFVSLILPFLKKCSINLVLHCTEFSLLWKAAATTCYAATHPRLVDVSGKYFADCNETSPSKLGSNLSEAARLWSASEIMVSKSSNAIFDPSSQLEY